MTFQNNKFIASEDNSLIYMNDIIDKQINIK